METVTPRAASTLKIKQPLTRRALHVVNRFSFGYTPTLAGDIGRFGSIEAWFASQLRRRPALSHPTIDGWFPHLVNDSPAQVWQNVRDDVYSTWEYSQDFLHWTLARRILSGNQVQEVMTDFWSNLLHIPSGEDYSYPWRFDYDRTIRTYGLTSYRLLLRNAVTHPAMSGWLSNYANAKGAINENLGRELLELYTVGVGTYGEADVKASAALLTGFTIDIYKTWAAGYNPARHVTGPVTVRGRTYANAAADGRAELYRYLDDLAMDPATAQRIANRLCVRFVGDNPPADVVAAVKKTYLAKGSDIKACLRTLVRHRSFIRSERSKMRTPVESEVAAIRSTGIVPTGGGQSSMLGDVTWQCAVTGQELYGWPRPDGFPEQSMLSVTPARLLMAWRINTWRTTPTPDLEEATAPSVDSLLPPMPVKFTTLMHHLSVNMTGRRATANAISAAAQLCNWSPTRNVTRSDIGAGWTLATMRAVILNNDEAMRR